MGATSVRSIEDFHRFKRDIWESDDEVEEFVAWVREVRTADLT